MRTVPTASKKLGRSGLASDDPRALTLPLLEEALGREKVAVELGWRADDAVEGTALVEKLRKPFKGGGSHGLVLLRFRW